MTYRADVGGGMLEHEGVRLFYAVVDKNRLCLAPDPTEVMETRRVSVAEVRDELRHRSQDFAPWFRIYLRHWIKLGFGAGVIGAMPP